MDDTATRRPRRWLRRRQPVDMEGWYPWLERWLPFGLLGVSAAIGLTDPEAGGTRLGTVVLVVASAAWISVGHKITSDPERARPWHGSAFVAGFLVLASVLMARHMAFFVFAISGFLYAGLLRPRPLVFVGTGTTAFSILFVTWGGFPLGSIEETGAFAMVWLLQTFLIGSGIVGGEKLHEVSEQRRRTVQELEATLAENEGLHAQLLRQAREAGVTDERQRLAREIHDTLAQGLTGIITQLEAADQHLDDRPVLAGHLDRAADLARSSLAEARRSVQALAPGALERGRLAEAIDWVARDWSEQTGVPATVTVTGHPSSLPARAEVELLRVAQEALTNAGKHAGATRVGVTLSCWDDEVTLDVRDDGHGFDADAVQRDAAGFGLTSMRQRVERLSGTLTIESDPAGTAVSAAVPVGATEVSDD